MDERRDLLGSTAAIIAEYRSSLADEPVVTGVPYEDVVAGFDLPLRDEPVAPSVAVAELAEAARPGLVATAGPRFFGFVVGGSVDAAMCADQLASGWDQVAFNPVTSPAAAAAEQVAGDYLRELLGVAPGASVGFVTGAQGANTIALAAARHALLQRHGWDVERHGLSNAPRIRVVASEERHVTIDRSLRLLGLGTSCVTEVAADRNGAIDVDDLRSVLSACPAGAPLVVCLQAGNVNTGACDDMRAAIAVARQHDAWVHVDGAFGLWAAASPRTRALVAGVEAADSWGCDGHKWLNVPFDSAYVFCAHPAAHRAAMSFTAAYLTGQDESAARNPSDWVPESSRRARGFATWAALRQLGRTGVAELVDRCCALARRFADGLTAAGMEVRNDVVLNQVLVSVSPDARRTDRVASAIQREGVCWLGATTWRGERLLRISVSNHLTTVDDVDASIAAIVRAARTEGS